MLYVSEWDVKAHFNRSTIYIAPLSEGAPWWCRLGCEHDTLRLFLSRHHAGTQPIRPTCKHYLTFISISLKSFSVSAVRQCLRLPKDTPVAFFHAGRLADSEYCSSENGCRSLESIECWQWWHSPSLMKMSFWSML